MRPAAVLLAISALFLAALVVQRARSGFLAAEAEIAAARGIAAQHGVPVVEVLALHEQLGGRLPAAEFERVAADFAAQRQQLAGVGALAMLAVRGERRLADQLLAEAGGSPQQVRSRIWASRDAVEIAGRFESVVARFAARGH